MVLITAVFPILAGFLLDMILGDPPRFYHPVRLIGKMTRHFEKLLIAAFPDNPAGKKRAGVTLAVMVTGISFIVPVAILILASGINFYLWLAVETLFCYQLFAAKDLKTQSMRVHDSLESGDLPGAREKLSQIVGRDTENLDESGVIRAAVETVSENTTDGVISPLFYMALGGAALGWFYKAANTLDSMVGYKDDRYWYFGAASAKLDDALNYIPARLAAYTMLFACNFLNGFDGANALRVFRRDRYKHESPNSAQTESVCAGALHIRLGGNTSYGGMIKKKSDIGDDDRPAAAQDIAGANRLMYAAALIDLAVLLALRAAVYSILFR